MVILYYFTYPKTAFHIAIRPGLIRMTKNLSYSQLGKMVQTGDTVKRQETFIKGKGDEALKYHVNAIIQEDFWQVVKEEKLKEGDFKVESPMSFGSSHRCRPTPRVEHRSMESDEQRSIDAFQHRSTKSVASFETVRIMTHEEFTAKHPRPPKPLRLSIDRQSEPDTDRLREPTGDRQSSPVFDR